LFDYPTIGSLSKYLTTEIETVDVTVPPSSPAPSIKPRMKVVDVSSVVQKTVEELLGTVVPNDAPLMGAGLDSIAAVDLVSTLSQRLGTELEPTALFDYPTIESLSQYLDEQIGPNQIDSAVLPNDNVQQGPVRSLWTLYAQMEEPTKVVMNTSSKSTNQVLIVFAFLQSGSRYFAQSLRAHTHLCVCEDVYLMPFSTLEERSAFLQGQNLGDGLSNAIQSVRNCSNVTDVCDIFSSVAAAYRAVQEWCAPRVLVDATEAYSALFKYAFA
jgi:acyl carrier protein